MHQSVTELAPNLFRLTLAENDKFEFNQFLLLDDKPLLMHAGKQSLFEPLKNMVAELMDPRDLAYVAFSHFEADESGALNHWLELAPGALCLTGPIGRINLSDHAIRAPQVLRDGEAVELGRRRLRLVETPHFPHNWDAVLWYEERDRLLFSSDHCAQGGICAPLTEEDISEIAINFAEKGAFIPKGDSTRAAIAKLAGLEVDMLLPMHGSAVQGQAARQVLDRVGDFLGR
ncbi:hypothetical protein [Gallaecimonas sp. GXIMD4217]|uniref:hypothetical protein n=1 Tax=Gallaecimonas sp. GXIMD4217 TaxID=3131927 RepID=UPI00311B20FE